MALTPEEQRELEQLEGMAAPRGNALSSDEENELRELEAAEAQSAAETPYAASASAGFFNALPGAKQIGAAGKTAMDVITGITPPSEIGNQYRRERDALGADLKAKESANPKVGFVGGLAAAPFLPLPAGAKGGAIYGGAKALGDSDADLTEGEFGQALDDTAMGAAFGAVVGDAAEQGGKYLSAGAKRLANHFSKKAEKKALAATGATGVQAAKFNPNAGRELLDRKIVRFGDGQEAIAERAAQAIEESGEGINRTLEKLDAKGVKVDRRKVMDVIRARVAELKGNEGEKNLVKQLEQKLADIEEQIPAPSMQPAGFRPADKPQTIVPAVREGDAYLADPLTKKPARWMPRNPDDQWEKLRGKVITPAVEATPIEQRFAELPGDSRIPIGQSEQIKRAFDRGAKWESNADSAVRDANKAAANAYRGAAEEAATAADPELAAIFKKDKETYGLLKPIAKAAQRRAMTTSQSPPGGFLDVAASAAGASVGGVHGALEAPMLRRLVAPRINSTLAVSSDALAKTLAAAPNALGKYGPILAQAAARGTRSLQTVDKILRETDPEYRRILGEIQGRDVAASSDQ